MQTLYDSATRRVDLLFDSPDELQKYLTKIRSRGLFIVRLPEPPQIHQTLSVRLRSQTGEISIESEVQQIFRSGATEHGVALRPLAELPDLPATEAPRDTDDTREITAAAEEETNRRSETTGVSIAVDIRRLNVSQRMRLATKASRLERQVLLRDNSPQVLMALVANPRIDEQEVRDLVRSPHAASGVLQHVAKDRRWSANYEIRLSLIKNPKTPTPLAQRLLPSLRTPDLQTLAKSPNVREAIKGAALRLYLGKL